jgi:transposase
MRTMMGRRQQREGQLFYTGFSLDERVGEDNRLRRIRGVVDFSFVRPAVAGRYSDIGQPSIDPIVVLKLMLICFLENVPSERELMRRLPERLDWLWFCEYDLDSTLPNHSVPSKARRRWGLALFEEFFARILEQCMAAGLVDGETVHLDSSLIAGDVSVDSLRPAFAVLARQTFEQLESRCDVPVEGPPVDSKAPTAETKLSETDPEARCRTKGKQSVIGYQEHRVVDDAYGIITASETTDASVNECRTLSTMLEQHEANTDRKACHVAADKAYGTPENYRYLQEHGHKPCIPHPVGSNKNKKAYPKGRFTYDAKEDCYRCPVGAMLRRQSKRPNTDGRIIYRAAKTVCHACPQREACFGGPVGQKGRSVSRSADESYVEWADACLSKAERRHLMKRRRSVVEGSFGDAATHHGFKRARWRNRWKMKIQNLMIATLQNLRKLLKYASNPRRAAQQALAGPSSRQNPAPAFL